MGERINGYLFELLEARDSEKLSGRAFSLFIMVLILFNVIAVILESVESFAIRYQNLFDLFELFSITVFTLEYLLRIWVCTRDRRFRNPLWGRVRFSLTPLALIDLVAVLPFYIPVFLNLDLRSIRVIRLFRLFRVLKMVRYSRSLRRFINVFKSKREELIMSFLFLFMMLIIASTLMYYAESDDQPKIFSNIPDAMWWAVVTLTTVGYGDIYPVTALGKLLGSIIAISGIAVFALPAGIIAAGFFEELKREGKNEPLICPHCGRNVHERHRT